MELKYKKALFGIALGIGLYFALNYLVKKSGAIVVLPKPDDKGFKSMDGDTDGKYLAKRYDPDHQNLDGSFGATWIAYDDSDIVGYWAKGKVDIGTELKP